MSSKEQYSCKREFLSYITVTKTRVETRLLYLKIDETEQYERYPDDGFMIIMPLFSIQLICLAAAGDGFR